MTKYSIICKLLFKKHGYGVRSYCIDCGIVLYLENMNGSENSL